MTIDNLPALPEPDGPATGTALTLADHPPLAPQLQRMNTTSVALDRLSEWVVAASNASALVAPLVDTPFVPDNYRPKVDPRATDEEKAEARQIAVATATAAVLQGVTLDLDPLTSLQQIVIIRGRPSLYAKMMVALVQSHGHEVWTEDLTDTRAVVAGRRNGSNHIERITITIQQARTAGWTRNDMYEKTPADMLWSRAAGRVCERIAADVLRGLTTVEQARDYATADDDPAPGTRTVRAPQRRAPRPVPVKAEAIVDPPLDDDQPPEPEPEPEQPEMITAAQQRKLHALLREHNLGDREAGLARISEILGREITSTKDLTKHDAIGVIDALDQPIVSDPPLNDDDWPEVSQIPDGA